MGSAGTAQREEQEEDVVVLDCRNGYESDVGKFQGAVPLNTNTFRSPHPPQPSTLQPSIPTRSTLNRKGFPHPIPLFSTNPWACVYACICACVRLEQGHVGGTRAGAGSTGPEQDAGPDLLCWWHATCRSSAHMISRACCRS